jgi:hypothetical protein
MTATTHQTIRTARRTISRRRPRLDDATLRGAPPCLHPWMRVRPFSGSTRS